MFMIFFASRNEDSKPQLAFMSSTPLVLGEVDVQQMAAGEVMPAPAYDILSGHYDIISLDSIDDRLLSYNLLLLAQVRALSADELIRLDDWVRKGGRVVILSDAALQWPSDYSLGDKRRPLFTSLLSPLFAHWGLEQILLMEEADEQSILMGEYAVNTVTPGEWESIKTSDKNLAECKLSENKFEANCVIEKGYATLIADSDFLHEDLWSNSFWDLATGQNDNMDYLRQKISDLHLQP